MKLNRLLIGSTLVAALGGFLFGFDTAVISGTTEALKQVFQLTSNQLGFTVASALIEPSWVLLLSANRRNGSVASGPCWFWRCSFLFPPWAAALPGTGSR